MGIWMFLASLSWALKGEQEFVRPTKTEANWGERGGLADVAELPLLGHELSEGTINSRPLYPHGLNNVCRMERSG